MILNPVYKEPIFVKVRQKASPQPPFKPKAKQHLASPFPRGTGGDKKGGREGDKNGGQEGDKKRGEGRRVREEERKTYF